MSRNKKPKRSFSAAELKMHARGELIGHYGTLACARVLNAAIGFLISSLFVYSGTGTFDFMVAVLGTCVITILLTLLQTGFYYMYLQIARGSTIRVSDLLYCFSHHPDHMILISLFLYVLYIVSALPFGLIWYLYAQYQGAGLTFGQGMQPVQFVILTLLLIGWFLTAVVISLPYVPVFFLYIDHPEWSSSAVLSESRARMYGYKKQVFHLLLSFIGLIILSLLSLGIGFIWTLPYIGMTLTEFYLEVSGH